MDDGGVQYYQQLGQQEGQKMSNNLDLWNKVNKPPPSALKTIGAGRLKGMSDINPQWRLQIMTENFGQIGVGWYYEIVEMWTEDGAGGELMAFVQINLFTNNGGVWSKPIAGVGGSALVAKESAGLRANDEGYKMATTDALSVAMKQLGVASAIYEGRWDGSKYKDEPKPAPVSTFRNAHGDASGQGDIGGKPVLDAPAYDLPNPERMESLKEIAAEIVDFHTKGMFDDAFVVYDNVSDMSERNELWKLLQPNSGVRSKLKLTGEEKRKANERT